MTTVTDKRNAEHNARCQASARATQRRREVVRLAELTVFEQEGTLGAAEEIQLARLRRERQKRESANGE